MDLGDLSDYIDLSQYEYDFEMMLKSHFSFPDEETQLIRSNEAHRVRDSVGGSCIIVRFYQRSQEIEACRLVNGRTPDYFEPFDLRGGGFFTRTGYKADITHRGETCWLGKLETVGDTGWHDDGRHISGDADFDITLERK